MSYFDDASLVMIPSGYKDQKVYSVKPLDGSGDLTFSRASSATRVASNGLIEKVRTNLILQSNTFSTTWTLTNASVTSGQAGYDGTNNAWLLSKSGAFGRAEQSLATTGLETFSVYVKAGSSNYTEITSNAGPYVGVNLTNGSIVAQSGVTPLVASVGSGWYRISIAYTKAASNVWRIIAGDAGSASSAAGSTGTILIQNAQAEAGDIATDYIATTSAAVSVGPVSGLPRLDYLNSTCPRLLLEPQRTNLLFYSEQFNNAWWTNSGNIVANTATSPSGYQDADTGGAVGVYPSAGVGDCTIVNTASIFAKANPSGASTLNLGMNRYGFGDFITCTFNLATGTAGTPTTGGTASGASAKIEDYGNGWYRCSITGIASTSAGTLSFNPNNTCFIWGAQLEAGAYATSYIPTLGTSVTRVADAASKTGISSLIGQTEGTLFIDIDPQDISGGGRYISIEAAGGIGSGWIGIFASGATPNTLRFYGDGFDFAAGLAPRGVRIKAALAYKNGVLTSAYVNGASVGTLTANTTGKSYANLALSSAAIGNAGGANNFQTLVFKTALTNAQLAELTTL